MALTQDCIESFVAALDSIGLRLTDMEGLRDFPVEEELGKTTFLGGGRVGQLTLLFCVYSPGS